LTSVSWADQELKTFRQIDLAPGEEAQLEFELAAGAFTIVDADGRRVVEPGEFELRVGPSSLGSTQLRARFSIEAIAG
jgi:beta-glucosidase